MGCGLVESEWKPCLGDLLPTRTHLIAPRSFRKKPPPSCEVHRAELSDDEVEQREGFRVTSPLRTLLDVAEQETVAQEQLNQVVKQALAEGIAATGARTLCCRRTVISYCDSLPRT